MPTFTRMLVGLSNQPYFLRPRLRRKSQTNLDETQPVVKHSPAIPHSSIKLYNSSFTSVSNTPVLHRDEKHTFYLLHYFHLSNVHFHRTTRNPFDLLPRKTFCGFCLLKDLAYCTDLLSLLNSSVGIHHAILAYFLRLVPFAVELLAGSCSFPVYRSVVQ